MAKYSPTSPYFNTPQNDVNLDLFVPRTITAEDDDQIEDSIYDFKPGVTIQLPKASNVNSDLGI